MAYSEANPSDYCSMWHVSGSETDHPETRMNSKWQGATAAQQTTNSKVPSKKKKKKKSALPSEAKSRAINKL